eukprot:1192074-Prorocentrum_minimum.AAC.4
MILLKRNALVTPRSTTEEFYFSPPRYSRAVSTLSRWKCGARRNDARAPSEPIRNPRKVERFSGKVLNKGLMSDGDSATEERFDERARF